MAKLTILIVDDEANQRLLLGQVLASLAPRCRILEAASAVEALRCLTSEQVDLIISDYQMPLMNGMDLVETLRAQANITPIILISAYNLDEEHGRAHRLNIDHVLVKPFSIAQLRRLASSVLALA